MSNSLSLKRKNQNDICAIWEARFENYSGETVCSLPGLEFLVPPYKVHEVRREGKRQQTDPNSVLVFNGLEEHVEKYQQTSGSFKSIVINQNFFNQICEPLNIKASELLFDNCELQQSQQLADLLKALISIADESVQANSMSVDCLATEITLTALTHYKHTFSDKVLRGFDSGHFPAAVSKMKSVMSDYLFDPDFDLNTLAQESGLSKFHMIRIFKQTTGSSPAKYMNQIKMDLAKQRLLASPQSILSIATELGFEDLSTFNKAFKKATGLSPSGFRQMNFRKVSE